MDTLFLIALVVEAVFGIGFLIAPGAMLAPFGVTLDAAATTFARLFGSALLSFPFLLWLARRSSQAEFKKGVVKSLFVYYLISTALLVIGVASGMMNTLGWSVVGIHLVLLVWFGYFLLK
jgi:hypothetical protein